MEVTAAQQRHAADREIALISCARLAACQVVCARRLMADVGLPRLAELALTRQRDSTSTFVSDVIPPIKTIVGKAVDFSFRVRILDRRDELTNMLILSDASH